MKVRYTVPALTDLENVLAYLSERSPQGARHVDASFRSLERLLADQPLVGARTRLDWLRRIKTPSYPYLLFYEVTGDDVIIHAVRHTARNPDTMPDAPS